MEDNIDFSLILNKHGWSTFLLSLNGAIHEVSISSVFSEPLYDVAKLLLSLLSNEDEMTMHWSDEPGWSIFQISRDKAQRHILLIEIGTAADREGSQYKKMVDFRIKQKQFLIIMFYQLKKNFHLLTEKSFAKDREGEFPYVYYKDLVKRIAVTLPEIL